MNVELSTAIPDPAAQGSSHPATCCQRLLVPTDFSPPSLKALHYACALAKREIELLHVVEPPIALAGFDPVAVLIPEDEQVNRAHDELEKIAAEHPVPGLTISAEARPGLAATEIVKAAAEWPADLVVLSTHGRTGLGHLLTGSVAEKVIRHCTCPMLLVRKHEHDFAIAEAGGPPELRLERILVPTDFSPRALQALRFARAFAECHGGRIALLHSLHVEGFFCPSKFPGSDTAGSVADLKNGAWKEIHRLAEEEVPKPLFGGTSVTVGSPLEEIPKIAALGRYDVIICATHGAAPIRHAILGSTAERLVWQAPCPVLVVPEMAPPGAAEL
jgi:nucleotide-binding universal stress UspA family protein